METEAYPLSWPFGWKRTKGRRREANFSKAGRSLTVTEGLQRVLAELQRMGIARNRVIISTNVPTRLDGLPRSGARVPDDPGAAVYWQEPSGARRVMAIDLYDRVADNLAAIAATLDAMRAIERHGGAAILERAFTGFEALPAPGAAREWWEVLGVLRSASMDEITSARRRLASEHHPDKGGDPARMAEINTAFDRACAEKGR